MWKLVAYQVGFVLTKFQQGAMSTCPQATLTLLEVVKSQHYGKTSGLLKKLR